MRITGIAFRDPEELGFRKRLMIKMLGNVMKVAPEELQCDIFRQRVAPFMAEGRSSQRIVVQIGNYSVPLKKTTKSNGHFRAWVSISNQDVHRISEQDGKGNRVIRITASAGGVEANQAESNIYLHEKTGVSVISDIDDTIKVSGVGNRKELLANTFLRKFQSIDGMADAYTTWANWGASFHYVSSSPWQLYEPLYAMKVSAGFPQGTFHLRNFRLHDQLLRKMRLRRQGKSKAIRALIKNMPHRKFVLVGDSGEKDPEIYLKICRKFPDRVEGLFIREIDGKPVKTEVASKIKRALPNGHVGTFEDASQLLGYSGPLFDKLTG